MNHYANTQKLETVKSRDAQKKTSAPAKVVVNA